MVAIPQPTLASLLQHSPFGLRLLTPDAAVDQPISWVSSSDLADPTPFLQDGQMLLTTGRQFSMGSGSTTDAADYVARLQKHGVHAIGFGTEVVRDGTPRELVEACTRAGIPLVEVPYRTPFIAIIRWVADAIAAEDRAREKWTIDAQRAINTAALTTGGADAALRALATHTGFSALRFDAEARVVADTSAPRPRQRRATDDPLVADITAEVARLLKRGGRAASSLVSGGRTVEVQTLGRDGQGRGALALISPTGHPGDRAVRTVTAGAVALIEMSIRDQAASTRAATSLGRAFLSLARDGQDAAAKRMARAGRLELPTEPVTAVIIEVHGADQQRIQTLLQERVRAVIVAPTRDELTVVCSACAADTDVITESIAAVTGVSGSLPGSPEPRIRAGFSAAHTFDQLRDAVAEARLALDSARRAHRPCVFFERTAETSLGRLIDTENATHSAAARLGTLDSLPEAKIWLRHNGQLDPAARELGIHRHSLKAKIAKLADQSGLDLDSFAGRAELWILLGALPRAAQDPEPQA